MKKFKLTIIVITVILTLVLTAIGIKGYWLYQAISPDPISFWQISNDKENEEVNKENKQSIDHQLWADVLTTYLSEDEILGVRVFDYQAVSKQDKDKLTAYIAQLQRIDPRNHQKNEQLAYWVNLYNALTINIVLKHYPIDSIKNIGDGITGPWNIELVNIAGKSLTLNQIEHGILRALWQDNRVHYVINCASVGCPDLPVQPLTSHAIEQQLTAGAIRFINQSKGIKFDDNTLILSSIYHWFSVDFGENEQQLRGHLTQYAAPQLKAKLKTFNGNIEYNYNWKLNAPK
jgi:hypothetical protein